LILLGGSESTFGNMNRRVPNVKAAIAAENAVQATANQLRNDRRVGGAPLAGTGLAGIGGEDGLLAAGAATGFGASDGEPATGPPGVGAGFIASLMLVSVAKATSQLRLIEVLRFRSLLVNLRSGPASPDSAQPRSYQL
jgi:hypothetical protein